MYSSLNQEKRPIWVLHEVIPTFSPREPPQKHPGFTIGHRWLFSFTLVAIVLSVLNVLASTGQSIGLTLFLGSFQGLTGVYFVLFFCSFSFNLFFWPVACVLYYKKQITKEMLNPKWIPYMFLVGICDALNGFLIVFSSHASRVPPSLTAILIQSMIPFTFIFSKILLKNKYYRWYHILSACIVFSGIIFSLVPTFKRIHDGTSTTELKHGWYWPFIFIIGTIPAALMNIFQEVLQVKYTQEMKQLKQQGRNVTTRYSVIYFQAVESLFQFIAIALCFGLDLIPGFGTSLTIDKFWESFSGGFRCFFNTMPPSPTSSRCPKSSGTGLLFIFSYIGTYITGTFLTDHISANWLSILTSLTPILATSFWFIFPKINAWAQAGNFNKWDIGFSIGALPIILIGMYFYKDTDRKKDEQETYEPIIEHPTELFW
ncbi:unnamed protein product [Didymodactylos carnosus]|uniref:Uncharacterized protein n=1 Tax=Didymodactylos carnosus TaxID=1234261 RepID=A0A814L9M8_9BILA|nr:unnamed protein product [Didymodactylos carnosus]CAF1062141.1 unnamed protein product [Didymodactylos carnosus]CAF3819804.1 unnamed protein product [Didymodactylos carnosus]CAF3830373.1 unnamed protein product [Didymodactylos carnosus]